MGHAYHHHCGCAACDRTDRSIERVEYSVRTEKVRECVVEAAGAHGVTEAEDALEALFDAEACGLFALLREGRPLNAIQSDALARLHAKARAWHGQVDAELDREVERQLEAA